MTSREDDNGETTERMIIEESRPKMYKDRYRLTYLLFYILGTATLVPQNFFTTATDYWMYKFRDPSLDAFNITSENRTQLQAHFISDFSIVSHVSNIVFLGVTLVFLRKIGMVKRVIATLCGGLVMFAINVIFVQINTDAWQVGFFILTLLLGFLLTACCSIFLATLFELIAKFPTEYLGGILSGHSLCGMFAALVQIFSLSIGASSQTTGLIYFIIGMFFVFLTLIGFLTALNYSRFFQYHLNKKVQLVQVKVTREQLFTVLGKVKYYLISMTIALGCSIMIHPSITSLMVSMDKGNGNKWNDVFFVPTISFLLYYAMDYIGRETAGLVKKPSNGIVILIASVLRIGFVPMIMLCNAQPRFHLPVVFDKDYAYIILIIVFSFTNGYLVNLCVLQVPRVTEEDEKNLSMVLILFFMLVSLGACSFLSAAMVKSL